VNSAFVVDASIDSDVENLGSGLAEPEYEGVMGDLHSRSVPGTTAHTETMRPVDAGETSNNAGTVQEPLYADLEPVNRSVYMDFRTLSAEQMRPI
jgi:hypothetical protein